jgi:hypothetical protein
MRLLGPFLVAASIAVLAPSLAGDGDCPDGTTYQVLEDERGKVHFCATDDGKLHGPAGAWWPNGTQWRSDNWKDGEKDGRWTIHDEQGTLREERFYSNGLQVGKETYWFADGKKKVVTQFESGEMHGPVQQWNESGEQIVWGQHRHGKQHGIRVIRFPESDFPDIRVMDAGKEITDSINMDDVESCDGWTKSSELVNRARIVVLGMSAMTQAPAMKTMDPFEAVACLVESSLEILAVVEPACAEGKLPLDVLMEPLVQTLSECALNRRPRT